jgi:uncharacterized protein YhfF
VTTFAGSDHTEASDAYFAAFLAATGVAASYHDRVEFGDDPATQDELAELVLHGPKRATTSAFRDYELEGQKVPEAGDLCVVTNGRGEPVCVYRSTRVDVARFGDVDDAFAWDEGEGDRSLDDWRRGHLDYFVPQFAAQGLTFDDDTLVVLERFTVVWPPEVADEGSGGQG